jgi:hypothetical protein
MVEKFACDLIEAALSGATVWEKLQVNHLEMYPRYCDS